MNLSTAEQKALEDWRSRGPNFANDTPVCAKDGWLLIRDELMSSKGREFHLIPVAPPRFPSLNPMNMTQPRPDLIPTELFLFFRNICTLAQ